MSWLAPLGFLGLLGLVALIIIYIIKPNFQNKIISSTYVWKKSLKFKKKKIPISNLRNILLFLCQVLIITAASLILAQPFLVDKEGNNGEDSVLIIDASASMLAESAGYTRFERTVTEVSKYVDELFSEEKRVSIIIASESSYFLVQQAEAESVAEVKNALTALLDVNNPVYTLGTPDIDGAMKLAEEITAYTANSEVVLYTDSNYIDKGKVRVVDVTDVLDYNVAILDVRATLVENQYVFEIDVACYGNDSDIDIYVDFYGVNTEETNLNYKVAARCSNDEITTLVFSVDEETATETVSIYEYNYVHVYHAEADSLAQDNNFYLYGGKKPVFKIQYYSYLPNNYFSSALMVLRNELGDYWDIEIDEVKFEEVPETEGYDMYIFEHVMPSTIPTDGIVILSNPDRLPSSTGIQLGNSYISTGGELPLEAGDSHPIMNNINPENITVTRFTEVANSDEYIPLMYCQSYPVVMLKDDPEAKVVVMTFSHNFSNLAVKAEFPLFMYNIMNYFAPQTFDGFVFDVNQTIDLNSRSDSLNIVGPGVDVAAEEFPHSIKLTNTGVYTTTQELLSGDPLIENFYVKLPASESNIHLEIDTLTNPYFYQETDVSDIDLLLYFAIALVALLFIEWWLKSREQI